MPNLEMSLGAIVLLAAAAAMAFYEWMRFKAGRPLLKGRNVLTLYWIGYLSLFILGITSAAAAFLR